MEGTCDVVMGSRFLYARPRFWGKDRSPYLTHYIGNILIVFFTNLLYGRNFTDYEGCYKAFLRTTLATMPVKATGFEFDNELICKLMRKGARIIEVPIRYTPRTYARGKKITWRHGMIMLWTIFKWRFLPLTGWTPATPNGPSPTTSKAAAHQAAQPTATPTTNNRRPKIRSGPLSSPSR